MTKTIMIEKDAEIISLGDDSFDVCLSDRRWEKWSVSVPRTTLKYLENDENIVKVKVAITIEVTI